MTAPVRAKVSWQMQWRLVAAAFDALTLTVVMGTAAFLRFGPAGVLDLSRSSATGAPWLLGVAIWLVAFGVYGLYSATRCANGVEEARRVVSACLSAPAAFVAFTFLLHAAPSRIWVATCAIGAILSVGVERRVLRAVTSRLRRRGRWMSKAVIVGAYDAKLLVDSLETDPSWGIAPVATCGFVWGDLPHLEVNEIGLAVHSTGANSVLVVGGSLPREVVQDVIAAADNLPVSVTVVPGLDYALLHNLHLVAVGNEPGLALERPHLSTHQRVMKRSMDIAASALGLAVLAPLLALVAMAVRLTSKGPAIFKQKRVGRNGQEFTVYKFRTMIDGAQKMQEQLIADVLDARMIKVENDPRITRIGSFLRKASLDELPQLWNVLKGDMSLVGPRPAQSVEVELYDRSAYRRLNVRPGLTGLWQIHGRSDLQFDDYVRHDITYVQNWGLILDAYIMLRTIPVVLGADGAR